MPTIERYRLARPELRVPLPDRGGRLFTADAEGEAVDVEDPFFRNMIIDGDLVACAPAADPIQKSGTGRNRKGK